MELHTYIETHSTPTEFANKVGVTRQAVYRWINKEAVPQPPLLPSFDDAFSVTDLKIFISKLHAESIISWDVYEKLWTFIESKEK